MAIHRHNYSMPQCLKLLASNDPPASTSQVAVTTGIHHLVPGYPLFYRVHTYVCIYMCVYKCMYVHTYIYVCVYICAYVYVCMCIYAHMRVCVCIYIFHERKDLVCLVPGI